MNKIQKALKNPRLAKIFILSNILGPFLNDKTYLKAMFKLQMGYPLNLKSPKTFSEKLQWLKLYDRKPEYTTMVDKYAVKNYVAKKIGEQYIIPTLGVWDSAKDIDFDALPQQFVLKCTHDSGTVVICRDKDKLDKQATIKQLNKWLKRNYYRKWREWPYKNVPPRIIAEKYMEDNSQKPDVKKDLPDYKFFCFNGEPKYCQVITGRNDKMCIDFFDKDWYHQPFHEPQNYPFADIEPQKPNNYEQMWNAARELAKDKDFSRIDFYQIQDNVYFGEITFYPTSGFGGFSPENYDEILGKMITFTGKSNRGGVKITLNNDSYAIEIIANDMHDYKFYCFDGDVKFLYITSDRNAPSGLKEDFFDAQTGKLLSLNQEGYFNNPKTPNLPTNFEQMKTLAKQLSQGIPHVRVDFYEIDNKIYFGELTFFCGSGFVPFTPNEWNTNIGNCIKLPTLY